MDDNRISDVVVAAIFCVAAILLFTLAYQGLIRFMPWPALVGQKAPVEVFNLVIGPLGAIAAFVALAFNARSADKTLRQAVRTERATRFQKAVELASSNKAPSIRGGITLLEALIEEEPKTYLRPSYATLATALSELNDEFKRAAVCSR